MIRLRTILLVSLAALGLLARAGRAEEGPIVIKHEDTHPVLSLDPFHGSLELRGTYEMDKSRTDGFTATASEALFVQELTLGTGGSIVSPNLFKWAFSGSGSIEEDFGQSDRSSGSSIGFFDGYDASVELLGGTQYPVTFYANRTEDFINRTFAGMLRNIITTYGASVQYRSPSLPTTLNIYHTTTDQSNLGGVQQYVIDQSNLDFNTSFEPADRQHVNFNYSYSTIGQNNPGAIANNSERQSVSVNHDWSIDPLAHYTLNSAFTYSNQTGTYSETNMRLNEQLRMHLTDTLDGDVTYAYTGLDYHNSSLRNHRFDASLTHRLFESLTTTARAGASFTDNSFSGAGAAGSSSTTNNYFAYLTTSYTKKVFLGRFGAHLSLGIDVNQSGAIGTSQQVLGDVQTFNDPQPIILTRTGVNANSVAVFDAAGTRRFVEGVDYRVVRLNNAVQVERLLGGNINSGDTVRLNYSIDPLPGYSSQSLSFGTGANYSFEEGLFKGLNVYIRYYQVDQTITPEGVGILPDSIRDTTFGAEYNVWKLTLRAEEELRESTLAPYNSLRLSASYIDRITDRTTLSLSATQSFIETPLDGATTSSLTIDGRLQYEIARNLRAILTTRWRNDSSSLNGDSSGLEAQAELRWNIRQTDIYLIVRHALLESRDNNLDTTILQVGLSRSF